MKNLFLLLSVLFAPMAFADLEAIKARLPKLVELKDQGLLGEQPDGLVGVIKSTPEAEEIARAENKDRMAVYNERAAAQGQSVETLMRVLGEARIRQEKTGRQFKDASGSWVKKQ